MVEPVVDEAAHLMLAAKQLERQEGANSQLSSESVPAPVTLLPEASLPTGSTVS